MEIGFEIKPYLKWESLCWHFYTLKYYKFCFILQIQIHQIYIVSDQAESLSKQAQTWKEN